MLRPWKHPKVRRIRSYSQKPQDFVSKNTPRKVSKEKEREREREREKKKFLKHFSLGKIFFSRQNVTRFL